MTTEINGYIICNLIVDVRIFLFLQYFFLFFFNEDANLLAEKNPAAGSIQAICVTCLAEKNFISNENEIYLSSQV